MAQRFILQTDYHNPFLCTYTRTICMYVLYVQSAVNILAINQLYHVLF